jgi:iron complex outermembrane receptor protein
MPYAFPRVVAPVPFSALSIAVLALLAGVGAGAQTTPAPAPTAAGGLPQITVTGQVESETATSPVYGMVAKRTSTGVKTDTDLLETPQSVSVVTREQIELQGAKGIDEAVRYTSGTIGGQFGQDPRSDWLLVRGFKPALYMDGMPLPDGVWTGATRVDPYAMERIEILKGPTSVMYGALPPSGFINSVSKRPQAEAYREIGVEFGSYNHKQATIDLTGPLSDDGKLLYRLVGLASNSDNEVDYITDKRYMLAPSLTWRPSSDTTLTVLGMFQKGEVSGVAGFLPEVGTRLPNPNGRISRSLNAGEPGYDRYEKDFQSLGYLFAHRVNDGLTLRQNLRFNEADVDHPSVGAFGFVPGSQRTLSRYVFTPRESSKVFSVDNQAEFKFATGAVGHTLLTGLDYKRSRNDYASGFGFGVGTLDAFAPVYGSPVVTPPDSTHTLQTQRQLGVYVQDQLRWDRWVATLSARHDSVDSDNDDLLARTSNPQTDRKWSGRVGLNYVMPSGLAPYIAYSDSFQPVLGRDFSGNYFQPTTGKQLEAGLKYRPENGNSLFTAAVFDLKQQNVSTVDPDHAFFSVQQGEISSKGLELEAKFNAARGLDIIASYTYTDAEVTRTTDPATLGKQVAMQPEHQASLWADYRFPGDVLPGFGLGGGVRYVGASYGDGANMFRNPSYTLLDLQAHYDVQNWRFLLTVSNLTNKDYVSTCQSSAWCFYGYGRQANLSARYVF